MSRRRRGLVLSPLPWTNQPLVLYHGTADLYVSAILSGVDVTRGRSGIDFGRGFYTTTSPDAAWRWATDLATFPWLRARGAAPAIVRFEVSREALSELDVLAFVRGDTGAEDFWSFVWHCRSTGGPHERPINAGWYDVVYGPIAAN